VEANDNSSEAATVDEVADYYVEITGEDKRNFRVAKRLPAKLATLPALQSTMEYDGPEGRAMEEQRVALRTNTVYTVGLLTLPDHYSEDRQRFDQIAAGFRLAPVGKWNCARK
jgi:hypothetical protein